MTGTEKAVLAAAAGLGGLVLLALSRPAEPWIAPPAGDCLLQALDAVGQGPVAGADSLAFARAIGCVAGCVPIGELAPATVTPDASCGCPAGTLLKPVSGDLRQAC